MVAIPLQFDPVGSAAYPPQDPVRLLHRVRLFQRTGMLGGRPFAGEILRATTAETLTEAYRLVHDIYAQEEYILPEPTGIRIRPFEACPEMSTFVGIADGEVVGVMSIVPDSPDLGLPSDHVFGDELDGMRAEGRRVAEVTNLAIGSGHRKSDLFFQLTKACFAQTANWHHDNAFIAICPRHTPFFRDVLQFKPCGMPRNYSDEVTDIVDGMTMDFRTNTHQYIEIDKLLGDEAFLHATFFQKNPFYKLCKEWSAVAPKMFRDHKFLQVLFVDAGKLLDRCSWDELEAIRRRWGAHVFAKVFDAQRRDIYRQRVGLKAGPSITWI